ncbi:MAG: response regulator [Pirellulales bacterium]
MAKEVVYIVDDDPSVLMSVQAVLNSRGFETRGFALAQEFLRVISPDEVGCVITDLQMPEINGLELQLTLCEMHSCLSLIMVTGFADVPIAVEVMSKGAVTVIEKPYEAEKLVEFVQRAMEVSRKTYAQTEKERDAVRRISVLTPEELQVMELAIRGLPNKAISDTLTISRRTVDRRRQTALTKARVATVSEFAIVLETARMLGGPPTSGSAV